MSRAGGGWGEGGGRASTPRDWGGRMWWLPLGKATDGEEVVGVAGWDLADHVGETRSAWTGGTAGHDTGGTAGSKADGDDRAGGVGVHKPSDHRRGCNEARRPPSSGAPPPTAPPTSHAAAATHHRGSTAACRCGGPIAPWQSKPAGAFRRRAARAGGCGGCGRTGGASSPREREVSGWERARARWVGCGGGRGRAPRMPRSRGPQNATASAPVAAVPRSGHPPWPFLLL